MREVPPWLTKGSGTPVRGKTPTIAPMLVKAWPIIIKIIPTPKNVPNESLLLDEIFKPLIPNKRNSNNNATAPINPNSSEATEKIESPIGSGK